MVKKNREAHAAPPSSEETDSSSSSSSSSSEGEGSPSTPPPPSAADKKPAALKKPVEPSADKEANSDSDSDESDSPVKPIASKPIDDGSKLRKPRSKPNHKPSNPTPFTPKAAVKRAPSAEDHKDSKKPKTEKREGGAEEEGKKSVLFQRLWSDDDEIAVLKGMLEYKEQKGVDPMADANVFYDFIKKSLRISFDRTQLVSKVRRLKKRYENSAGRKTFNAHETIALELSKKIWGDDPQSTKLDRQAKSNLKSPGKTSKIATNGATASSSKMKNAGNAGSGQEQEDKSVKFIGKASISMGLDESIVKVGLRLCSEDKKAEIEEKWKQLHLEESKIFLRKLDLAREENKMIMEALKSGEK